MLYWYSHTGDTADLTDQDILKARQKLEKSLHSPEATLPTLSRAQNVRLAVGNLGFPDSQANQELADLVTAHLSGVKGLELVERQSLDKVLRELRMSLAGLVRAKAAVSVGKLVGADWFLLGTLAKLNGHTSLVLRVVDARTGILHDAGVVSAEKASMEIAADIVDFIRQSRQGATNAQARVYLAIGSFEDLSVNNRLADFPSQLRGFLLAAFRNSYATLLEREQVDALLEEVRLDWAGLSDEGGTGALQPMQSAFWLVDGWYQSDEKENRGIELTLEVRRIFGTCKRTTLQGKAGEGIEQLVKATIDSVVRQENMVIIPTRMSEVRAQMGLGKDLARLPAPIDLICPHENANWDLMDQQERARRRRNAQEAIRAFETVLLLEPTNSEAKLWLAACLRKPAINQMDKAIGYYREVLEAPVHDSFFDQAEQALHCALLLLNGPQKSRTWLEAASGQTGNPAAAAFYRSETELAHASATIKEGGSTGIEFAEQQLFTAMTNSYFGVSRSTGISDFVKSFGTNQAEAAQRLTELYPSLKAQSPQLSPYFLASIVTAQISSNAPIVSEFEQMLDRYSQSPEQVFQADNFWWLFSRDIYDWCFGNQRYAVAVKFIENKIRAAAHFPNHPWGIRNEDRMMLAYAYLGTEQWANALQIFDSYSNQPVRMETWGPWGGSLAVVSTAKQADYCRHKLGQTVAADRRQFELGKPVLALCPPSTFIADNNGLWLGLNNCCFVSISI